MTARPSFGSESFAARALAELLRRQRSAPRIGFRTDGRTDGLAAVLGDCFKMQNTRASARSDGAHALVLSFELGLVRTKRSHHRLGHVVPTIGAPRITAGHEKKSRRTIDNAVSSVTRLRPRCARAFLYVETETDEIGHDLAEPWRVVLASTSLRESSGSGAMSAVVHHIDHSQRSTRRLPA